ncbi:MAG: DUF6206 family protein [Thermodesulfobacteriota bacterium]
MRLDLDLLERFEAGLNPQRVELSSVPAVIIGYGEISAIFQINGDDAVAYKRMPLFSSRPAAVAYAGLYETYCRLLGEAGLLLPKSATAIVEIPGRPVVLYIGQQALPARWFGHQLIHRLSPDRLGLLIRRIMAQQEKIQEFNRARLPGLEIAVDGQLSNWAIDGEIETGPLYFIDTSTPFIRRNGRHELDVSLLLKAVPAPLRGLTGRLLAGGVLDRYFDARKNRIDLAANLYKEQRPDLVPVALTAINDALPDELPPVREKEVAAYYRSDRMIWRLFLALRRADRFFATRLLGRRYEFILPGKIRR